jgi:cysteine-rich repeat protein
VSVTTAGASGRFLPCWTLFAPDGTPVGFPTACGQEERVLPATGSYRIRVFDNNDAETGSYAIGLEVVSGATADPRCSEPLACGQTVERAVDAPGETDTFRFPGLAGQVVTIATAPASGLFLPCWELFAPDGSPVGGFRSCGEEARTLPVSGAYTIKVFDNNHREGGAYAVSLEGCGAVTTTTLAGSSTTTLPAYALRRTLRPPAAGAPEEELGAAVAFAATDVLIGAPHDETGGRDAGAVFVVEATGDPGSPDFGRLRRTLLAPAPLAGDRFGAAVVAVGADVAVGAPGDDAGGDDAGAVYVFGGRDGALLGRLVAASATPGGRFGESLAVRGAELVVGAPGAHASAVAGAGRVYVLVGATGQERLVLEDPETPDSGDAFGFALAGAGAMLAVGAPGDGGGTGSVFLFDAQSGAPLRTLRQPSGARGDGFGSAVGVLGDRILVGAPGAARDTGKAFLFDARTGALLRTFEKRSPQPGDRFGATVALTERGALIAAPTDRREVEAGGAVYLVDVETGAPLQVFQKEHPEPRDLFGSALAAAGDGLLIGAPFDDSGLVNGGAAYLFRGDAIAAVFRKRFPGADFGAAVAGAGGALLVGAPLDGERRGAVHVFDAGSGEARAMLTPELAGGARFGFSLATAGTATVVGAPFASVGGVEAGSVAVFADTTVRARLSGPSPRAGDQLGFAVATVDADVLVGAPLVGERDEGEAYLYDRASGELERTLRKPTATSGDFFGAAVAGAGDALVIGAPFDGAAAPSAGAAYVFGRRDGTLRALLASPAPAPGDQLGAAVAASATRIVVGAPLADAAVPDGGAVHVFDATTHALLFSVSNPAARPGDQFGTAVALADGNVLVGAPLADGGAVDTGAAYVFDGSTGALLQALPNPAQAAFDRFGFAVAGVPEGLLIGAPGPSVAYLFARAGFAAQAAGITPLAAPGGERCGNGIVEAAEECDDGNAVDTDDCRLGCRRPICCIIDPQAEQRCDDRNQCTDDRLDPVVGCVHTPNGRCCGVDADCPGGKCRLCNGCFIHEWACCESGSECVSPPDCSARSCFDATRCVCQGELECAAEPLPAVVRERFREACDRLRLMESIATEQAGAGRHGLKTTARLGRKARRLMKSAQRTARVSAKREGLSKACRKALLKRMRQAIKAVPVRKLRRCLPLDRTTARHTVAPSGVSQSESNTGGRTR